MTMEEFKAAVASARESKLLEAADELRNEHGYTTDELIALLTEHEETET